MVAIHPASGGLSATGKRLLPILVFEAYLTFTVLLFAFGPWPYPVKDPFLLYGYVAAGQACLLVGYLSGITHKPRGYFGRFSPKTILLAGIVASLVLFVPTLFFRTGTGFGSVITGLTNPGEAYRTSLRVRVSDTPIIEYLRMPFGPLFGLTLPLGVFWWHRLALAMRIGVVLTVLCTLLLSVAEAVNRDIILPLTLIAWVVLAGHLSGQQRVAKRAFGGVAILLVAGVIAFSVFFTRAMRDRPNPTILAYDVNTHVRADLNNPLIAGMPAIVQLGVIDLSSYLSQGYYALGLALEKPFTPTYGFGHSMFLKRQSERFFPQIDGYPDRLVKEDGYDVYGLFTTAYPWIASDVTFEGALLVVFVLGRLFALSWLDTLKGENPFALGVFVQLIVLLSTFVCYLWNTNSGEGLATFWGLIIAWTLTRRRYVWRAETA